MNSAIAYTALSAMLTTFAVMLLALRIPACATSVRRALATWQVMPRSATVTVLATLAGTAALSAQQVAAPAMTTEDQRILAALLPPPVSAATDRLGTGGGSNVADSTDVKDRALASLRDYTQKIRSKQQAIAGLDTTPDENGSGQPLADVGTMIERLAARLEAEPDNPKGWTMLGWSYVNTGKTADAISAYKTALKYDPGNADTVAALAAAEETLSRSPANSTAMAILDAAPLQESGARTGTGATTDTGTSDKQQMIRAMVDRLAKRLDDDPNDAEGWVRLMKSRTVLGETELAREALRRALAAFAGDQPARDRIADAAKEFGLNAN